MSALTEACAGRWRDILPALGVDPRHLTGRHGPCPVCEGKDRFRFANTNGKGEWFCSGCGNPAAGDGVALVMAVHGCDFREAAGMIEPLIGMARVETLPMRDEDRTRRKMQALWRASVPLGDVPAARRYWEARCGGLPACADLRALAALPYSDPPHEVVTTWPAMIARVRDQGGRWVNLHRTWLSEDGAKAPVASPRKTMAIPFLGGEAVRLSTHGPVIGVAEGIETAVAAERLFGVPTWSVLNAGQMEKWSPPPGVEQVVIFADNDASARGQAAAWTLARKLIAKRVPAEVRMPGCAIDPEAVDTDWRDVWMDARPAAMAVAA